MTRRRAATTGAVVWALLGAVVASSSLGSVNADAHLLVVTASVAGPLLAVGAARQLSRAADRSAGALLVFSALVTPTYFAYAVNLPALVAGFVLVIAPHVVAGDDAKPTVSKHDGRIVR